ncbi:hypothetical protein [Pseudoalteromonas luteoviolacea]|uniref:Uncharacterized protein n=1 Tax=Pseudoalteromonas luteoviolacea H33 TaxID=1365251 RepID=A0A167FWY0_9GAMM|nr:hypothetical protein [Pseudoalteromonas luteoviolacea]KZN53319.1 hypothetical protein N476_08590 [Pseudoalteromonas luteoviolacea H33]KZN76758.1 hypothetical protein N477_15050 [Pseudoalteromonas luteoviolacea H33-S]MBQ4878912.1 hypothetical protein [Pseudoalteromonas luteoviolacea]MBQ4907911.1 hypothetical protein [Pseudoalteromonas luteoviolacea]
MSLEQDITRVVEATEGLTATVDNQISEITSKLNTAVAETKTKVDAHLASADALLNSYEERQSHFRVTKNQALVANQAGTFPEAWTGGYVTKATLLEKVESGVEQDQRSALAREFLQAIDSDRKFFAQNFNIWELEYAPNRGGENSHVDAYMMYQYCRRPTHVTVAAIVKHIRGIVPTGFWCSGLQANEPAKVCGAHYGAGGRNHYMHCHPYVAGKNLPADQTGVIQVALPAVVTGHVPLDRSWSQFAYIGDGAYDVIA